MKATLVHIETGVEYYENGSLITPTPEQKLLWFLIGLPVGVERIEQTFETEIAEFSGYTKKDIQAMVDADFANGKFSFLPAVGVQHNFELKYHG